MAGILENPLAHKDCLEIIRWLSKLRWGSIIKKNFPLNGLKVVLKMTDKGVVLRFKHHVTKTTISKIAIGKELEDFVFKPTNSERILKIRAAYLRSYSPPSFEGIVPLLHSIGFAESRMSCFKLLIPITKAAFFHYQIESTHFISDTGLMSSNCASAIIDKVKMLACIIKDKHNGKLFLCIETAERLAFPSFTKKAHALRNALGYLTGYLPGGHAYYFAFSGKQTKRISGFRYTRIRNEIKSGYSPLNSNPYSWIRGNLSEANRYYKDKALRSISIQEFSVLCQRVHDNIEVATVLLLILESSVASLTFMPGGFAIALEMISDIIVEGKKIDLRPVKNRVTIKKIRNELLSTIERYKIEIDEDAAKIFTNKINGLNQITNSARLRAPFEILGIKLDLADYQIINTRNDFLHGKVPDILNVGKERSLDRVNGDLYYASMKLYTLLNMVILKWIGFDNYVLNFPKIQERACGMKIKEKHYRKI